MARFHNNYWLTTGRRVFLRVERLDCCFSRLPCGKRKICSRGVLRYGGGTIVQWLLIHGAQLAAEDGGLCVSACYLVYGAYDRYVADISFPFSFLLIDYAYNKQFDDPLTNSTAARRRFHQIGATVL